MTVRFSTDEYSLSAMEGPQAAKESMHQERSLHLLSEQIRSKNLGLSAEQAARKLVLEARQILDEYSQTVEARPPSHIRLLKRAESIMFLLCAFCLLGFFIFDMHDEANGWVYPESLIVESLIVICFLILNLWLYHRETYHSQTEVLNRAKDIVDYLEKSGLNMNQLLRVPKNNSISMARVLRNGATRNSPFNLLVEGDIIELMFGDVAPSRVRYIPLDLDSPKEPPQEVEFTLNTNDMFRPRPFFACMGPRSLAIQKEINMTHGRFYFEVLETPLRRTLVSSLENKRPTTVLSQQVEILRKIVVRRFAYIIVAFSFILSFARFILCGNKSVTWFGFLIILPLYSVFPFLPFTAVYLWVVLRAYGNAKVLTLFEQLQQSTTPFDDDENVDEFDEEAPPPTKDVKVASGALLHRFISLLRHRREWMLTHSTNLLESLCSATVICSVDREGTIASPFATIEKLFVFNEDSNDMTVLDINDLTVEGPKFEDRDWRKHLKSLKPFGLELLLNTNCGATWTKGINEVHRKNSKLSLYCSPYPARESCLCALAKEMGFSRNSVQNFQKIREIYLVSSSHPSIHQSIRDDQFELPSISAVICQQKTTKEYMVFLDGSLELVLDVCCDYWNGAELVELDLNTKKKIIDIYHNEAVNDTQCISYAYGYVASERDIQELITYCPSSDHIFCDISVESFVGDVIKRIVDNMVFLCMTALTHEPKEDVREFTEDLRLAGIRFVYFSNTAERESKAFAERLGVETDWNSCILLSSSKDPNASNGYLEVHDIKAKLPRGIENIRSHLEKVDDIPLHVSLFADCNAEAVEEMIKIFQENGEVVCCTGSTLRYFNTAAFALADLSIAIEPYHMKMHKPSRALEHIPLFLLGASFTTLPASLVMHHESSPYVLTQIIRESRYFMNHLVQSFAFGLGAYISIAILCLLSYAFFLPPIFIGFQILWLVCAIIPLLSLTFLFSPYEVPDVMKLMPGKNKDHLNDISRLILQYFARFIPVILMTFLVYFITLLQFYPKTESEVIPAFADIVWITRNSPEQWATIYAQNCASFIFVFYLVFVSSTFMFRTLYIWEFSPFRNRVWVGGCVLCLILQAGFCSLFIVSGPYHLANLTWVFGVAFSWPFILVAIQELMKRADKKEFIRFQKRSKLEFNTKLGCYSPV